MPGRTQYPLPSSARRDERHGDRVADAPESCTARRVMTRTPDLPVAGATWTCPVHPDIRELQPGTCPHCGAALVPVGSLAAPGDSDEPPDGAA